MLAQFTRLKRYTRFDDFLMLIWAKDQYFILLPGHILYSLGVIRQYRGQIKLLQFCKKKNKQTKTKTKAKQKTKPTDPSCYYNSEKVQFDLSTRYHFIVFEEKVKGQNFGSTGSCKKAPILIAIVSKCLPSKTIQNQNRLPSEMVGYYGCYYGYAAKTVSTRVNQWTFSLHHHVNETYSKLF